MNVSSYCKLSIGRASAWLLFAATALLMTAESTGQQFMFQANGNDKDAMRKQFTDQLASKKSEAANRLACRISDIGRACDLTSTQTKKLEIAAKGAVNATMKDAKAAMAKQAKMMGIEFDPDEDNEEETAPENEDEDDGNINAANVFQAVIIDGFEGNSNQSPESQKIWTSSLKKVLSEEQAKQWEQWQADRKTYQTEMAVGSFVAKADRRLLLSGEQREQLAAHLVENHGELLRKRADRRESNQFGGVFVLNAVNNVIGGEVEDEENTDGKIGEILTVEQLEIWNKEFASKLKSNPAGNVMGGGVNMGAINLNVNGAALNIGGLDAPMIIEEEEEEDDE